MLGNVRNVHPFQVFLKHPAGMRWIVHFRWHIVFFVQRVSKTCFVSGHDFSRAEKRQNNEGF
jgi:hypothetical protein